MTFIFNFLNYQKMVGAVSFLEDKYLHIQQAPYNYQQCCQELISVGSVHWRAVEFHTSHIKGVGNTQEIRTFSFYVLSNKTSRKSN